MPGNSLIHCEQSPELEKKPQQTSANRIIRKLKSVYICGMHSKIPAPQADLTCNESKSAILVKKENKTKNNQPTHPKLLV